MKLPETFMPEKDLEKNIETLMKTKIPLPQPATENDHVRLENVYCKDKDGNVFERYNRLFVRTSLATTNKIRESCFTLPGAVSFFERQKGDVFLPSNALTCSILAKLYELRHYEEMESLLLQYSGHKKDGWHLQNTLVDWNWQKIMHYPGYYEIPKKIKKRDINYKRACAPLEFNIKHGEDAKLEFLLREPKMADFIKDLTGLENPEILVDIGDYFKKPTRVWFPDEKHEQPEKPFTVWIGCRHDNFDIFLASKVNYPGPARGVYTGMAKKKK
ncbi:hypothetical protein FJZ53_06375 [Candidatus Woesearchaeota archaeon]|nr:hypothetical protein [Candidatus Woesearchaeota archaeon]